MQLLRGGLIGDALQFCSAFPERVAERTPLWVASLLGARYFVPVLKTWRWGLEKQKLNGRSHMAPLAEVNLRGQTPTLPGVIAACSRRGEGREDTSRPAKSSCPVSVRSSLLDKLDGDPQSKLQRSDVHLTDHHLGHG